MYNFSNTDEQIIICDVCPRRCHLKKGQNGFCFIRCNTGKSIEYTSYGHITALAVDPVEKKPLFNFYPSSYALSLGTYGCNMGCKFCQNHKITKFNLNPNDLLYISPQMLVRKAREMQCQSIAFTYNDPVIFYEYVLDVSKIAINYGIKTVAVSAGYAQKEIRKKLFTKMDAVNIDLKAFSSDFYKRNCAAELSVVLDTLKFIKNDTNAWLEITNLIIEGENDSPDELINMCEWIVKNLGKNVPLHFSAFHPAYKMLHNKATSSSKLSLAYDIARKTGLNYVYVGNIRDIEKSTTYCKECGSILIERDWFKVISNKLNKNAKCPCCGCTCDGIFI